MEAGLGISEWFMRCQDEFLSTKREQEKERERTILPPSSLYIRSNERSGID